MISRFTDEYRWLSNFSPATVWLDGLDYLSVEHAYVAAKTLSEAMRFEIRAIVNPGAVKRFGKLIELRRDWEEIRLGVMENLVRQKFRLPEYEEKLLATGKVEIVEGNNGHDNFWGVCLCGNCRETGQNNLGKIIMKAREELVQPLLTFE